MNDYIIFTDSACDINEGTLMEWGVEYAQLSFSFEDDGKTYSNYEMPFRDFYQRMRKGGVSKTSAINVDAFKERFALYLQKGLDILYIGFSSGLSTTVNSARIAADELKESYPDRKIIIVDSLCASAGEGLLVYLTVKKKLDGAAIEEAAKFAEDTKLHICHWFTVDDLVYLKRGGRISPTVAFVGGLLGVKPVLHVDNDGHLVNVTKTRGRLNSINALADKYDELCLDKENGTVFISHGDCIEDAERLAGILKKRHGVRVDITTYVGPVIGAHSGPGTLALFFVGRER